MSDETKNTEKTETLDDLLDNALNDFQKGPTESTATEATTTPKPTTISSAETAPPPSDAIQKTFEAMCFNDEKFLNELESLPNFLSNFPFGLGPGNETDTAENQNIFNLFSQLGKHAELLQKIKDEDIEKALEKLADQSGSNATSGEASASAEAAATTDEPHVEQLNLFMSSILSKDVMLPACQAVDESYEEWLTKNKESLSEEEIQRYRKQHQCVKDICQEYQTGSSDQQQMQRILQKFQELQTYGDPPKELLLFPGLPGFGGAAGEQGLFDDAFADADKVGQGEAECSIM